MKRNIAYILGVMLLAASCISEQGLDVNSTRKDEVKFVADMKNAVTKTLYGADNATTIKVKWVDGDKIKEFKYGFRGLTYYDFSYLGPIGSDSTYPFGLNTGTENGFGIILEDGTDYGVEGDVTIIANPEGYGRTYRKHEGNLAWGAVHWWNSSFNRPYFWLVEFSTKNITTDHLSMQLAMLNQCQSGKSPRYWKVEWSLSDITEEDDEWKFISEFTVPDVIPDSFDPAVWMSSAFKPMDIPLPSAMLGHDKVYLRIGPANNKASDRYGYDNATIESSNYSGGTMNYFAIRYNK